MNNITFAIIKPDAVKNRNTGKIYDRIISAGFEIKNAKLLRMTQSQAEGFYAVHKAVSYTHLTLPTKRIV